MERKKTKRDKKFTACIVFLQTLGAMFIIVSLLALISALHLMKWTPFVIFVFCGAVGNGLMLSAEFLAYEKYGGEADG